MRLIVTRPAEEGQRLAIELQRLGHEADNHPLLEIVHLPPMPLALDGVTALIVTSRSALRSLSQSSAFEATLCLPVYCVGGATAALAVELGFAEVHAGPGTAKELARFIVETFDARTGTLLYLTGDHLAFDLEAALRAAGLAVRRVIAYESREPSAESTGGLAEKLRAGFDGVVLMSPRTARIFAEVLAAAGPRPPIICYCLSDAVAEPLRSVAGLTLRVASEPTLADLLALIGKAR